jgi:hypothetical protein
MEKWQALARGMKRLLGHAPVECALGGGIVRETNTQAAMHARLRSPEP